jgi:hypothetical protein
MRLKKNLTKEIKGVSYRYNPIKEEISPWVKEGISIYLICS